MCKTTYTYMKVWQSTCTHIHTKHTDTVFNCSILWPCRSCLFSPQTITLHQELYPYAPICVLHAKSYKYFCERCCALLWIGLGEHGKSHCGRPQVHHWGSASQQNTVCKYTNKAKTHLSINIKLSVLEDKQKEGKTLTERHPKEEFSIYML